MSVPNILAQASVLFQYLVVVTRSGPPSLPLLHVAHQIERAGFGGSLEPIPFYWQFAHIGPGMRVHVQA